MNDSGLLLLSLPLFLAGLARGLFTQRRRSEFLPWGFGAYYGGPHFGIPVGWPSGVVGVHARADQRIVEEIHDRLLDEELDLSDVHITVHSGHVALTGVVVSRTDRRIAELLAESVPGTVDVDNRLTIGPHGS